MVKTTLSKFDQLRLSFWYTSIFKKRSNNVQCFLWCQRKGSNETQNPSKGFDQTLLAKLVSKKGICGGHLCTFNILSIKVDDNSKELQFSADTQALSPLQVYQLKIDSSDLEASNDFQDISIHNAKFSWLWPNSNCIASLVCSDLQGNDINKMMT